jgi:hypothetical protein
LLLPVDADDPRESVRIVSSSLTGTKVMECFGLGVTGFYLETDAPAVVGTQARFTFRAAVDGFSVTLPAMAIHERRSSILRGEDLYMSTWVFTDGTDETINRLVASAASASRG